MTGRSTEDSMGRERIRTHKDLRVWQDAVDVAMVIFDLTKRFPAEERFSLVDQIRRSSRSVAANLSEAWRRRRYEAAFVAKLNDCETEATETQTWLEFSRRCGYLSAEQADELDERYEKIIAQLVKMITNPKAWILSRPGDKPKRRSSD